MTRYLADATPLARIAADVSERSRVGIALLAADFALGQLESSHNFPYGRAGLALARRWYDGETIDPCLMEEALHSEEDEGIDLCEQEAKSERERAAWHALATALAYIAFHAYKAIGRLPGSLICEVNEHELDELSDQLVALSPNVMKRLAEAADLLRSNPSMSYGQLRSMILLS